MARKLMIGIKESANNDRGESKYNPIAMIEENPSKISIMDKNLFASTCLKMQLKLSLKLVDEDEVYCENLNRFLVGEERIQIFETLNDFTKGYLEMKPGIKRKY